MLDHSLDIQGRVAPGFEPVLDAFKTNFSRPAPYAERGAAFAARVGGELMVDLWAGDARGDEPWRADTLINVWSTTKAFMAAALAQLVEAGEIAYADPVAKVWPEFAADGKNAVTVEQVLSHQAGLPGWAEPTTIEELFDWDLVTGRLAAQAPLFTPGERTVYHPVTYGFLAGEIVRRVTGLSPGAYIREHVAKPSGADIHIGLADAGIARLALLHGPVVAPEMGELDDPAVVAALANPVMEPERPNTDAWRRAELPALGGAASARGLAAFYDGLIASRRGEKGLITSQTLELMCRPRSTRNDGLLGFEAHWGAGVINDTLGLYGGGDAFGHSGWGGSFGAADPQAGLAMGYVCNQMGPDLVGDPRGKSLAEAVRACLKG